MTSSSLSTILVSRGTPMTAGMNSDLAMIEVCDVRPPTSVAKPTIGRRLKWTVSDGVRSSAMMTTSCVISERS